jgi:transposase
MASELDDELWNLIQPLLSRTTRRYRHPGRRQIDDRKLSSGTLFVLLTGIRRRLPSELRFGSGHDLPAAPARLTAGGRGRSAFRRPSR